MDKEDLLQEFRRLFPELSDQRILEAKANYDRFIENVLQMYEAIREDPERYAKCKELLDEERRNKTAGQ
jgi:hypothetical protein